MNIKNQMKCIYCLEEKSEANFLKVEHVIPQSFGGFKNNLTLKQIVCDDCNKYFGDHLELILGRGTFEGVMRFEFDVKKAKDFKPIRQEAQMVIKVAEEGMFEGSFATRKYFQEQDKILLTPLPQIGFLRSVDSKYDFFLLHEVPLKKSVEVGKYNFPHNKGILILGCDEKEADKVLLDQGYDWKKRSVEDCADQSDKWTCEVEGKIGPKVFRAVSKIAFNYMAYFEGRDFVIQKDFDLIRRYIRFDEKADYPLTRLDSNPILSDEPESGNRRVGHIIVLNNASDKKSLFAKISLFNWATYYISLSRNYNGIKRDIVRGHFFNTPTGDILPLGHQPS